MPRLTLLAAVLLLLPGLVAAQDPDTLRTYEIDPIVVTGTRIARAKSTLPASLSVVARETIAGSGETNVLPVAARHAPGLFLQARGTTGYGLAPGSGGTVSIRGISGAPNTRVLMLIDGQPQFMGIFGHPISDAYAATDVERVEVIRGPASVLYGSNALAGAVNLITRQAHAEGTSGSARASVGSYGTQTYSASGQHVRERLFVFGSANHDRTDGVRDDRDDSFRVLTGYLKAAYRLTDRLRLSADGTLADARFHDPGPVSAEAAPADARRDYLRGRAALSLGHTAGRMDGSLRLYTSFGEHAFSGGFESNDVLTGVTAYENVSLFPGHTLTLGIDHKSYGGEATIQTPGGPVTLLDDERLRETDVYALAQQRLLAAIDAHAGVRLVDHSRYGAEWVPAFGVAARLGSGVSVRGSVSKGFRSPMPVDLFIGPVANSELEPERVWNVEAGLARVWPGGRGRIEATVFRTEGENLIQVVGGPNVAPRRMNTGTFTHRGVELMAEAAPAAGLRVSATYAYLDTEEIALLAPKHNLNAEAVYVRDRVRLRLGGQWVDDLATLVEGDGAPQSYLLLDAGVEVRVAPAVRVFVQGENLGDETYQIDFGYPMPGRALTAGVAVGR